MRLETDLLLGTHPAKNRDYDLYIKLKASFEEINVSSKVTINTDLDLNTCIDRIIKFINMYSRSSYTVRCFLICLPLPRLALMDEIWMVFEDAIVPQLSSITACKFTSVKCAHKNLTSNVSNEV